MIDSAFSVDNLNELALFPDLYARIRVRASDNELIAEQFRAELGKRENPNLDASSRNRLAHLVTFFRALLLLDNSDDSLADGFEDELRLANFLPNPNALGVNLDLLAHLSVRDLRIHTHFLRHLLRYSSAERLANSLALFERRGNSGGHLLDY